MVTLSPLGDFCLRLKFSSTTCDCTILRKPAHLPVSQFPHLKTGNLTSVPEGGCEHYETVPVTTSAEGKGELPHRPTWWSPALCLFSFPFLKIYLIFSSVQSLSRVRLCNTLGCSTPGLPVHHQLPELAQTHVQQVGDAIQPFHPLLSPSPPAFNLFPASRSFLMSRFFTSRGQSTRVSALASVLPMNIQD